MDKGNENLYVIMVFLSVKCFLCYEQYLYSFYLSLFQLAKLGIDIILISRSKTKLEAVAAEIGMNKKRKVDFFLPLLILSLKSESHRRNVGNAKF